LDSGEYTPKAGDVAIVVLSILYIGFESVFILLLPKSRTFQFFTLDSEKRLLSAVDRLRGELSILYIGF